MTQNNGISKMDSTLTSLLYRVGFEPVSCIGHRYYCRSLLSMQDTVERLYCFVAAGIRCYKEYLFRDNKRVSAWVVEIPDSSKGAFSGAAMKAEMLVQPVMGGRLPTNNPDRNKPLSDFKSGLPGQAGVHFIHTQDLGKV